MPVLREASGAVTDATRAELEGRGLADSADGTVALALAARIDVALARGESGSAIAALSREYRATLRALAGAGSVAAHPLDELRRRRERRYRARPPAPQSC